VKFSRSRSKPTAGRSAGGATGGPVSARAPGILTAPPPARLIPRGKYGVSIWVHLLLSKFLYGQPTHRLLRDLSDYELTLSAGTVTGGLRALAPLFEPLEEALLGQLRARNSGTRTRPAGGSLPRPKGRSDIAGISGCSTPIGHSLRARPESLGGGADPGALRQRRRESSSVIATRPTRSSRESLGLHSGLLLGPSAA
jgi:hypothetical protein